MKNQGLSGQPAVDLPIIMDAKKAGMPLTVDSSRLGKFSWQDFDNSSAIGWKVAAKAARSKPRFQRTNWGGRTK